MILNDPQKSLQWLNRFIQRTELKFQAKGTVAEHIQNSLLQYITLFKNAKGNYHFKAEYKPIFDESISKANKLLKNIRQTTTKQIHETELKDIIGGFSQETLELISQNLRAIQLSEGCSVKCPNCNFMALPNVRKQFSWKAVEELINLFGKHFQVNQPMLYHASDPLDFEARNPDKGVQQTKTYHDVLKLVYEKTGVVLFSSTAVPSGKEALLRNLWQDPNVCIRISVSEINAERLRREGILNQEYKPNLGKPGNSGSFFQINPISVKSSLYWPSGREYEFNDIFGHISCINGAVIRPDGLWQQLLTATTPLTPNGYFEQPVTPQAEWIFKSKHRERNDGISPESPCLAAAQINFNGDVRYASKLFDHQCLLTLHKLRAMSYNSDTESAESRLLTPLSINDLRPTFYQVLQKKSKLGRQSFNREFTKQANLLKSEWQQDSQAYQATDPRSRHNINQINNFIHENLDEKNISTNLNKEINQLAPYLKNFRDRLETLINIKERLDSKSQTAKDFLLYIDSYFRDQELEKEIKLTALKSIFNYLSSNPRALSTLKSSMRTAGTTDQYFHDFFAKGLERIKHSQQIPQELREFASMLYLTLLRPQDPIFHNLSKRTELPNSNEIQAAMARIE